MHDVVVGNWEPNDEDIAAGIYAGFGASINVLNGGIECRGGVESGQATNRVAYYKEYMNYFGVEIPDSD